MPLFHLNLQRRVLSWLSITPISAPLPNLPLPATGREKIRQITFTSRRCGSKSLVKVTISIATSVLAHSGIRM